MACVYYDCHGTGAVIGNMVNKIDGNHYYEYTKMKNVSVSDTGEKFSLDYKQEELSNSKEKKEKEVSGKEKQQAAEKSGVRLEISSQGRSAGTDGRRKEKPSGNREAAGSWSFFSSIQEIFKTALETLRELFDKIWNEPENGEAPNAEEIMETEEAAAGSAEGEAETDPVFSEMMNAAAGIHSMQGMLSDQETIPETAESYHRDEERMNREIQPYLRRGDLNQVISILTDNGKKTAAKNSTLLTYYDRTGRMVEPNASDSQRILYGDRNTRKL